MVVEMPPFSGHWVYCPKCNSDMKPITTHYPRQSYAGLDFAHAVSLGGAPEHDWLFRSCSMCHYGWFELCADHDAGDSDG
jgi:hypothetical protein